MKALLTDVIAAIVNDKLKRANGFGVSIINLPDIDFASFVEKVSGSKKLELYFLGYDQETQDRLEHALPSADRVSAFYTVEEADLIIPSK